MRKNFERMYVITNAEANGWSNSDRTTFVISLEEDMLEMHVKSGRNPFVYEFNTAFGRFMKEYAEECGPLSRYNRTNRYRFAFTEGISGRQDTYIEIDLGDGYPQRRHLLHESCFGKTEDISCFLYDFLDLCVASGFFSLKDGFYTYLEEEDVNADQEMKVVKPRIVSNEEGWTSPWEEAKVVYLNVCREEKEKDHE